MKTLDSKLTFRSNKERLMHLGTGILFGLLVLVLVFGLIGCSDDNDRRNNNINPYNGSFSPYNQPGFGNWGGGIGFGGGAALGNGTSQTMQVALEFQYVDQAGGIVGAGQMFTGQPLYCGGFAIPPDQYILEPIQPGFMQNNVITNLRMVGRGFSGDIVLNMTNGIIYPALPKLYSCNGPAIFDELSATIQIESINGYPCFTTIYVDAMNGIPMCQ